MIFFIIGGIGSGKTITAVKEIVDNQHKNFPITNFKLKNINYHRLKVSDIVQMNYETKKYEINWKFWEDIRAKHKNFSIYLDEAGYLASSRSSMTGYNKQMIIWVSQVRKILADSENNHLYIISQRFNSVDIGFRELSHAIVLCTKLKLCPKCETMADLCTCKKKDFQIWIVNYMFDNILVSDLDITAETLAEARKIPFCANPYFNYYESAEIVKFGESEYL